MYLSLQTPVAGDVVAAPQPETAPSTRRTPVARVVVVLGLVSLLTDISSESVSSVLPLYVTAGLGLSVAAYGVVDGLHQGVSALVRIGSGWAADTTGHPKWVALAGYAGSAGARVALLFVTGLGAIAAVVSLDRIGKGVRTAPRDAMIAAATPAPSLGRAFGVHRALDAVGAALGPLVAALVLWWIPTGYRTVFVISLGFAVLGVVVLGLFVLEPRPAAEAAPVDSRERLRLLADRRLRRLLVVTAALGLVTVSDGFLYLALLDRGGFATYWFPLMYVGTNVAFLALAVPLGRLSDRVGRARVLLAGHVALLGAYLCATAPGSASATLAALALLGAFYAATDGAVAALASSLVDPAVRASAIGGVQTSIALSRLVSSLGFGLLWFALGPHTALLAAAACLVAVAALVAATVLRLERPAAVPA